MFVAFNINSIDRRMAMILRRMSTPTKPVRKTTALKMR
jgi:hypothetical protein